jgi:hypothetical protein
MNFNGQSDSIRSNILTWLPVVLLMIIAAYTRFLNMSGNNYLLVGGDGPYYPLQVRSLLEHQKLALPDMPLLFLMEGLVATVFNFFHIASYNECIIMAVKAVDVLIPPLAAIPVFLISKELNRNGKTPGFFNYLLVAFAVINFTTTGAFSNGLQKNAVAVIWIFLYLYFVIRLITYERKKDAYYAGMVLLLCTFTHFGSCALLIFMSILLGISWLLYNSQTMTYITWQKAMLCFAIILMLISIIAYYDTSRLQRLMAIPLKVFEFPVLMVMTHGLGIENFLSPIHLFLTNFMALLALIILLANRKKIDQKQKLIAFALIASAFFLASPFIGLEWANRLYIMSYIPVVVIYLILLNSTLSKWVKFVPASVFSLCVLVCLIAIQANRDCISSESYAEFIHIKDRVNFHENDAIIGRQDLRLLGSWELRTKAIVEYLFKKEDFKKYHAVYVIRQLKGSNFASGRFRGDAPIPDNSVKVYSGPCFELYQVKSTDGWKGGKGKPSKARGIIVSLTPGYGVLKNDQGFLRTIELTDHTLIELPLKTGASIEVWGTWKPFSLNVVAEQIAEFN